MRPKRPFDYNRALTRLIQLRYEARRDGKDLTSKIMDLERQIYAHLLDKGRTPDRRQDGDPPEKE